MQFVAINKYIWCSPYKLRPLVDVIRGKDAVSALNWLALYKTQRTSPLQKTLESAIANAKDRENIEKSDLIVKEIRVDQGPIRRYHKPGAMGRAMVQRKRSCHLKIVLEPKQSKKA
jgi:large subunit ribosomal protein L22